MGFGGFRRKKATSQRLIQQRHPLAEEKLRIFALFHQFPSHSKLYSANQNVFPKKVSGIGVRNCSGLIFRRNNNQ
jgi:hypothetical protein